MHQAAATYWNQIAEQNPLKTTWAQQMFPLPQESLDKALEQEEARLTQQEGDPIVAAAYLKVAPLLWEQEAISNFLLDNPSLRSALPPQENVSEALVTASQDFRLTPFQLRKLKAMLEKPPT